jgi:RIO-like serine/threonine protein kinase
MGSVLRQKLVERGAILLDRDVRNNPDFANLGRKQRMLKRIHNGKRVLSEVVNEAFIETLFTEVTKIHACAFIYGDIQYGNIIIEKQTGRPYLLDFDRARYYPGLDKGSFRILCDQDVEKFNLYFNTEKPTYKRRKKQIQALKN